MTKKHRIAVLVLLLSLVLLPCSAEVSPEEAAKLKTTLTPMGGERAGNKEGTIPEWTGKVPPLPPGIPKGRWPGELFPDEKPLFSITAENMDQYADKLTEGVKGWLKKHPTTFRLDVYPTHRTGGILPEYVYEATFRNATRGKVSANGLVVTGAIGGAPFPIPKSGIEVLWNLKTAYRGSATSRSNRSYILTPPGKALLVAERSTDSDNPWHYEGMTEERFRKDYDANITMHFVTMIYPPVVAGEMFLAMEPSDYSGERVAFQYVVGQRRTRRAPSVEYDLPSSTNSGYGNNDEAGMFLGKPDKFNWKLVGKKEVYIPYNCNRLTSVKDAEAIGEHHLNPELVRWELHRVWVVELTLVPGQRHMSPRRLIYFDEDSWLGAAADLYDSQGGLWKAGLSYPVFDPRVPYLVYGPETYFNLETGGVLVDAFPSLETKVPLVTLNGPGMHPRSYYTPDSVAARGIR